MKIALLHSTSWPDYGSAENLLRDQSLLLSRKGHEVTVITGLGVDPDLGYRFIKLDCLSPEYPIAKSLRAVLDNGQFDQDFANYRAELEAQLTPLLEGHDFIIVHDHFTVHFNLALTHLLHELSSRFKFIAWTHHLAASGIDYAVPNPTKQPWSFIRQAAPGVTYVVPSELRARQMMEHLNPSPEPVVIPHVLELAFLYQLTPEIQASLEALNLPERDYVFFCPSRAMPRKNLDQAIEFITKVIVLGKNPVLLITGGADPNSPAGKQYSDFLRDSLPEDLAGHIIFVSDHLNVHDEILLNLYQLSDAVLYLSGQSGFGRPVLEAALHRLPVICAHNPAEDILGTDGIFTYEEGSQVPAALDWLEAQISFRMKRRARKRLDIDLVYQGQYLPLFNKVMAQPFHTS